VPNEDSHMSWCAKWRFTHELVCQMKIHTWAGVPNEDSHMSWCAKWRFTHELMCQMKIHTWADVPNEDSHMSWCAKWRFTHELVCQMKIHTWAGVPNEDSHMSWCAKWRFTHELVCQMKIHTFAGVPNWDQHKHSWFLHSVSLIPALWACDVTGVVVQLLLTRRLWCGPVLCSGPHVHSTTSLHTYRFVSTGVTAVAANFTFLKYIVHDCCYGTVSSNVKNSIKSWCVILPDFLKWLAHESITKIITLLRNILKMVNATFICCLNLITIYCNTFMTCIAKHVFSFN